MTTKMVNAWIFLNEDEPHGTTYNSPTSCYQTLIKNNVYQSVDLLYLCFATTIPTSAKSIPPGDGSSYTIEMGASNHRDGLTNQDYMNYIIRDSKKSNPNIKIAMTLEYGNANVLSQIFPDPANPDQQSADNFAANLMAYLKHYAIDGFDLDWESPICDTTTQAQFRLLIDAIGAQFKRQKDKHYYLTLSPASPGNLDVGVVNRNVDFLNLQLYSGFTSPSDYSGVNADLFAYGAKFESGYQTAQQAYDDNKANYHYSVFTQWRLNSGNYQFEQTQQQQLYALVFPK
jgi:GH18 family chitinase